MSNLTNQQKATYALLADNVYWDVRYGYDEKTDDFTNSNWTPVPEGWMVIDEISGSGLEGKADNPELQGFTARVFENTATNEVVISFAGTQFDDYTGDWMSGNVNSTLGVASKHLTQAAILYHKVLKENPTADIKFTGHSLGGGIASVMGVWFDEPAIIFDPAPFKHAAINDGMFNVPLRK